VESSARKNIGLLISSIAAKRNKIVTHNLQNPNNRQVNCSKLKMQGLANSKNFSILALEISHKYLKESRKRMENYMLLNKYKKRKYKE
jgi:hypothetical protein